MDTRQEIEAVLDRAYAARQRQDIEATTQCFAHDVRFALLGGPQVAAGGAEFRSTVQGMFDTFELLEYRIHCRVIDPPRAVVHWRGKFRARQSGRIIETDILDLSEIRDGKIAAMSSFFDTAQAQQALA